MLDGKAQFSDIKLGLFFRKGDLSGKMEAEIPSWAIIQSEVEVVWCLECEVQIDDELVVGLFKDICLDYGIF